mgnify:FL=1|jgi:hypothetical protein|tara:strand:- start:964 stop:1242 length:279 start_codon:yes stop_codon:yes gene_type:complete
MTVQEIMERAGTREPTLVIAWIKDAINLIQSNKNANLKTWKFDIIDGQREYTMPTDLIKLKSISVKDTQDKKYKKIKRLVYETIVTEDTDPE